MVQIIVGELMSGLMFSYAVFFLTRVFMLQILAVLSPLAILASALPQTEKLFKTWLSWLVGWATAGILTIFLLSLGFSTIRAIIPTLTDSYINLNGAYSIFLRPDTLYWLMLCVYMICVDTIIAGTIPAVSKRVADNIKKNPLKRRTPESNKKDADQEAIKKTAREAAGKE